MRPSHHSNNEASTEIAMQYLAELSAARAARAAANEAAA
jgi:hypothetical protein